MVGIRLCAGDLSIVTLSGVSRALVLRVLAHPSKLIEDRLVLLGRPRASPSFSLSNPVFAILFPLESRLRHPFPCTHVVQIGHSLKPGAITRSVVQKIGHKFNSTLAGHPFCRAQYLPYPPQNTVTEPKS